MGRLVASMVLVLGLMTSAACAQVTCIQQYLEKGPAAGLGFAASDVDNLVGEIAAGIGLSADGIVAVPCAGENRVRAYFLTEKVPVGEYILYDPQWVREVLGVTLSGDSGSAARAEAIVLFGHELGHFLGRHFTANKKLDVLKQETAADHFAGCAAAFMRVDWARVEGFLSRIRGDADTTHPSREHAIEVASEGFQQCRRVEDTTNNAELIAQLNRLAPTDFDGLRGVGHAIQKKITSAGATANDNLDIVAAMTSKSDLQLIRDFDDLTRKSIWAVLGAVDANWWRANRQWEEARRLVLQSIASFENFERHDRVPRSAEMLAALKMLQQRVDYRIMPGRIIVAWPFRVRLDYCSAVTCDVEFILRGFDERGNLRFNFSEIQAGMKQGEFRNTTLGTKAKIYFEPGQQLVDNAKVAFKLYCRANGINIEGSLAALDWTAANEVSAGYATWLSCNNPQVQASIGISVAQSPGRNDEQPVQPDPGPPF